MNHRHNDDDETHGQKLARALLNPVARRETREETEARTLRALADSQAADEAFGLRSAERDEKPTERPPANPARSMNGARRTLDYRKGSKRMQRCSRCHHEIELAAPVLYDLSNNAISGPEHEALSPIMVGNQLLGFACSDCFHSLLQHICSVFPDSNGFPLVDHHGQLATTPRCDECGAALAYAADGRSVLCPQCDTDAVSP